MTNILTIPDKPTRADILALEAAMLELPNQTVMPLKHTFSEGVYAREAFLPAGTVLTGKIHKHAHLNIISQGLITVWTEFGKKLIRGPFTFVSEPGIKRAGKVHEDTVWITVHLNPSNTQDLKEIEQAVIVPSYANLIKEKKI